MEKYIFRVIRSKEDGIWYWKIKRNKTVTIEGKDYLARIVVKQGNNSDAKTAVAEMKAAFEGLEDG